jgi:hypothetical protein
MSVKFDDLATELKTTVGQLTTLAEILNEETANSETPLNLPIGAKVNLTNEDAVLLRNEFKKRQQSNVPANPTPQLNPGPMRNTSDIQQAEASDVPTAQQEAPTASEMDTVHINFEQAISAQETQDQQLFENDLSTIKHHQFQLGVLKAIYGATANTEGFMAGQNALAAARNAQAVEALKRKARMLAGTEGADFLPKYPNVAQLSTEIPEAPKSLNQQNSNSLDRLKKSSPQ